MSKLSAEAFITIQRLADAGRIIHVEKHGDIYQVTVFKDKDVLLEHSHYEGKSLSEALSKIDKKYF